MDSLQCIHSIHVVFRPHKIMFANLGKTMFIKFQSRYNKRHRTEAWRPGAIRMIILYTFIVPYLSHKNTCV